MSELRIVFRSPSRGLLFRLILVLLAYSLVPLGEIFLFLYIADQIGNYLILAAAALAGLPGALIALRQVPRALGSLKGKIRRGEHPGRELVDLAGILAGCVLLLTPGFATDLVGYLLLIPPLRGAAGRWLARRVEGWLRELSDSLRPGEPQDSGRLMK